MSCTQHEVTDCAISIERCGVLQSTPCRQGFLVSSHSAGKDIPRLLRHQKIHCRSHERPPLDLFQPTPSHLTCNIHCASNVHRQCLGLLNGHFLSVFPTTILYAFFIKINSKCANYINSTHTVKRQNSDM